MRSSTLFLLLSLAPAALAAEPPLRGVEPGDLDRSVDPCTDLFEFANGTWRAQNPIPPSMMRWNRRFAAAEATKDQLKAILEEVSSRRTWPQGSVEQLIGDQYAACVDEGRVDALGVAPVGPVLAEIEALKDAAGVQRMIGRLHQTAIRVPFGLSSASDNHNPSQVIADIHAEGLGLPDRDYYLKPEPRFEEIRSRYRAHVASTFKLAGRPEAEARAAAETVFAMEKRLAEASLDNVSLRDPKATDHKTSFAELKKLAPSFDWAAYFDATKLPHADLNVEEPKFLAAFDHELAQTPVATWKIYLQWHLLHAASPSLSRPFVEESFDFYGRTLRGTKEMKPRWKRCVESTDDLLGEALGRKYTERYFPPAAKARMQELVKNLLLAMGDTIRGLTWMGATTKAKALEKLLHLQPQDRLPGQVEGLLRGPHQARRSLGELRGRASIQRG